MFDSIRTIPVRVRPPYDVRIGSGLLGRCGDYLAALLGQRRIAVLADDTVASLYLDTVTAALEDAGFAVCSHIFPSGEGRKNLSTLTELLEFLASEHLTRTDCVAALGGGVTGDMAGFAAAVYLRGIRYVQLPTTLLAAVDSSVGGKTAVDLTAGKNLAGAFCQPAAVICDTDCLKTLPPDVFADGAAEAVKTAGYDDAAAAAADGTAFVFMGHGTSHTAKVSYSQMQTAMQTLGYDNVFIGTVEGEPEDTACDAVIEKVKEAGYTKVILRPLMVVAGDHANNDMAGADDDSWLSQFNAADCFESVDTQIAGLGEIGDIQQLYVDHAGAAIDSLNG